MMTKKQEEIVRKGIHRYIPLDHEDVILYKPTDIFYWYAYLTNCSFSVIRDEAKDILYAEIHKLLSEKSSPSLLKKWFK